MKDNFNNIFSKAKKIELSQDERKDIKYALLSEIKKNPFKQAVHWRFVWRYTTASIAVVVVFVGGSLSVAAKNALPGDLLYSLKTNINEEVAGLLQISPRARADYESQRIGLRLEEARLLALEGRLDENNRKTIERRLFEHASEIDQQVKKIEFENKEDAVEINSKLETTLRANSRVLAEIEDEEDDTGDLAIIIAGQAEVVSKSTDDLEDKITEEEEDQAPEKVFEKTEEVSLSLIEIENDIKEFEEKLSTTTLASIARDIDDTREDLEEAKTLALEGSYGKAYRVLRKSLRKLDEVSEVIELKASLPVKVKKSEPEPVSDVATTTPETATSTDKVSQYILETLEGKVGSSTALTASSFNALIDSSSEDLKDFSTTSTSTLGLATTTQELSEDELLSTFDTIADYLGLSLKDTTSVDILFDKIFK